jgi:glycine/D-amino acid oxidase-like deaminating enzyme
VGRDDAWSGLHDARPPDVAVVGAGITGLTTAVLLKNAGLRVAVLEAGGVCLGATGYTTAKVTAQHGPTYSKISSTFGDDGARAYAEANTAGLELIAALVAEHGIDCAFERRPHHLYTESDSAVSQIEQETEAEGPA